jgi:NADH-quinone oxidoreductase subunit J
MLNLIENLILVCLVASSSLILIVSNPVQSLLSLVLTFALSSIIFMHLGTEFMSLLIFMVYIGAIAVLFLFVIMMLNIKIVELRSTYLKYLPIGIFISFFFLVELFFCIYLQYDSNTKNNYSLNFEYLD